MIRRTDRIETMVRQQWRAWLESPDGEGCRYPTITRVDQEDRIQRAFMAGIEAAWRIEAARREEAMPPVARTQANDPPREG